MLMGKRGGEKSGMSAPGLIKLCNTYGRKGYTSDD